MEKYIRYIRIYRYCMSKNYLPILTCKLQYKMGHYFSDIQYDSGPVEKVQDPDGQKARDPDPDPHHWTILQG